MRRSGQVMIGSLVLAASSFLAGCGDDGSEEVDAEPVCAVEDGDNIRIVDAGECSDRDGRHGGGTFFWYHVPAGGHYPAGSHYPRSQTHSRLTPGSSGTSSYGKPGAVVKVPARGGFGGTAVKGGGGAPAGGGAKGAGG